MQEPKICPYPGLRPFTEEESIFFKGRDKHIQEIIHQAEEKKFVMLTGASGDGKSSIVYAGIIPQARAGFFKAKYNNWLICTFRPERTPLKNLTKSLAENLHLDIEKTETELAYGFSALIDIYRSSPYYINEKSEEWLNADEKTRKQIKRKGANLFILVDQFEEFFTNPENYNNGKSSEEAQTVVNLLLETAKIALAEDITIYIICTMRSDYIGQCAAFRNLPEFIGFSQFFVPRLKRKEIYDVIEEPALLSGNSISKRLIEVLVNDLREGFDQLPVLQHALNQVWKQADNGNEEMDLLHLAKVCGMPSVYLPQQEKEKFNVWYNELLTSIYSENLKADFENPSLENVLNAHSNELYEKAYEYYNSANSSGKSLSKEKVKFIIKKVFQCLTKIDDSRAVRNRMTLKEITDVIDDTEISSAEVNSLINIFREQGNTLIYPFINEITLAEPVEANLLSGTSTRSLSDNRLLTPETVLDITHESLIRNWNLLKNWSDEENENYQNYIDFKKQLDRWIANEKRKGFLLPIGPYTFFESWFENCKLNKYWLAKYDDSEITHNEKLQKADVILNNTRQFLKKSAAKLFVSRFVLKHGANKIAATIGVIALIFSCTYFYFDFREKQNEYVLNEIIEKGKLMLRSKTISNEVKTHFVINTLRLTGSFHEILDSLHNDTLAFDIAFQAFCETEPLNPNESVVNQSAMFSFDLVVYLDKLLTKIQKDNKPGTELMLLKRANQMLYVIAYYQSYGWGYGPFRSSKMVVKNIKLHKAALFTLLNQLKVESVNKSNTNTSLLSQKVQNQVNILNTGLEIFLLQNAVDYTTYGIPVDSRQYIDSVISCISPFESVEGKKVFESVYSKNKTWQTSALDNFTHNGGYQILAYLYASKGDISKSVICVDSIIKNNSDYKEYKNENFFKILTSCLIYKIPYEKYLELLKSFEKYSGLSIYEIAIENQKYYNNYKIDLKMVKSTANDRNIVSEFNIMPHYIDSWDFYKKVLLSTFKSENDLNFNLALYYKRYGIFTMNQFNNTAFYHPPYPLLKDNYLKMAFDYYSRLPENYLNEEIILKNIPVRRSSLFLYPVMIENMTYPYEFYSNKDFPFLDFILKENQYRKHYKSKDDFELLEKFICHYINNLNFNDIDSSLKTLDLIKHAFALNPKFSYNFDKSVFSLLELTHQINNNVYQNSGDSIILKKINELKVFSSELQSDKNDLLNNAHLKLLKYLADVLAQKGFVDISEKVVGTMAKSDDRINTLTEIIYNLQYNGPIENTFIYLDTLFTEIDQNADFGSKLIRVMSMIGSSSMYELCIMKIKDIDDKCKPRAMVNFIRGVAFNGLYYNAYKFIPEYVSSQNELELYNEILHTAVLHQISDNQNSRKWKNFDEKYRDITEDFVGSFYKKSISIRFKDRNATIFE